MWANLDQNVIYNKANHVKSTQDHLALPKYIFTIQHNYKTKWAEKPQIVLQFPLTFLLYQNNRYKREFSPKVLLRDPNNQILGTKIVAHLIVLDLDITIMVHLNGSIILWKFANCEKFFLSTDLKTQCYLLYIFCLNVNAFYSKCYFFETTTKVKTIWKFKGR